MMMYYGGACGKSLGHECGALTNGISAFAEEACPGALSRLPWEDARRSVGSVRPRSRLWWEPSRAHTLM